MALALGHPVGQPPDSLSRHAVPDGKQDGRRGVPFSTRLNDAAGPRHSSAPKVSMHRFGAANLTCYSGIMSMR